MAKQKSKSKPAAGTPQVPRYGELYSFGLYDLDYPAYADENGRSPRSTPSRSPCAGGGWSCTRNREWAG